MPIRGSGWFCPPVAGVGGVLVFFSILDSVTEASSSGVPYKRQLGIALFLTDPLEHELLCLQEPLTVSTSPPGASANPDLPTPGPCGVGRDLGLRVPVVLSL